LFPSPKIIRVTKSRRRRWGGHVARMRDRRGAYMILIFKGNGPLRRPRRRWDVSIKMCRQEM